VLLVEDLATDGGSKVTFVDGLRNAGAEVVHIFVVFFYGAFPGAEESMAGLGVTLHFLATWNDVLKAAEEGQYFDQADIDGVRDFLDHPVEWSKDHGGRDAG
jgi:orotate phosphoribosyltransferase